LASVSTTFREICGTRISSNFRRNFQPETLQMEFSVNC
jgi:hypothetical protein